MRHVTVQTHVFEDLLAALILGNYMALVLLRST